MVRDGADLAKLSDEAFGAVLNHVVTEKDGAAIGRSFDDPEQQLAAIDAFKDIKPQNDNQRQLLANEVRQAGFADTQGEQGGLFGDDPMESLIGERVKVMDRLRQELVRDRRLFSTLNSNADRAQKAGNRIATDQNEAFQDASARAIDLLERVTTTPDINQQINDAARRVSDGESVASAARELKETLLNGNSATDERERSSAPDGEQDAAAGYSNDQINRHLEQTTHEQRVQANHAWTEEKESLRNQGYSEEQIFQHLYAKANNGKKPPKPGEAPPKK